MENLVGKEVFNKRSSVFGVVIEQDEANVSIELRSGEVKVISHSTFKRWWTETPSAEPFTEQEKEAMKQEDAQPASAPSRGGVVRPAGEAGIGLKLRDKFIAMVKDYGVEGVEVFYKPETRSDVVKLNGRNVFECTHADRRFNVLCHPDSLTPDNKKKITKLFPKEWGWSLRAKFVFTEMTQGPLMKSIISDGLFYRSENQ